MRYLLIVLMLMSVSTARAFDRVGTSAAQFLKLGAGARELAMGSCGVTSSDGVSAICWNPAGIRVPHFGVFWQYSGYYAGIEHYQVTAGMRSGRNSTVTFMINMLQAPDQEITTLREPDGNGLYYRYQGLETGISMTRRMTDRLWFGVTGKFVREQLHREVAQAFALDAGIQYEFLEHKFTLAGSIANFGSPMKLHGTDLLHTADSDHGISGNYLSPMNLKTESWPLPLLFHFGLKARLVDAEHALILHPDHLVILVVGADHLNDNRERIDSGFEYGYRNMFFVRTGYRFNTDTEGLTMGCGFRFHTRNQARIELDYSWRAFGDLGDVSAVSACLNW